MKQIILEEEYDPNYEPSQEEINEYGEYLGLDMKNKEEVKSLIWIAREGLKAPLPNAWKPCKTDDDEIYYFNFDTGESSWEHPCDEYYKKMFEEEKKRVALAKLRPKTSKGPKKTIPGKSPKNAKPAMPKSSGVPGLKLKKLAPLKKVPVGKRGHPSAPADDAKPQRAMLSPKRTLRSDLTSTRAVVSQQDVSLETDSGTEEISDSDSDSGPVQSDRVKALLDSQLKDLIPAVKLRKNLNAVPRPKRANPEKDVPKIKTPHALDKNSMGEKSSEISEDKDVIMKTSKITSQITTEDICEKSPKSDSLELELRDRKESRDRDLAELETRYERLFSDAKRKHQGRMKILKEEQDKTLEEASQGYARELEDFRTVHQERLAAMERASREEASRFQQQTRKADLEKVEHAKSLENLGKEHGEIKRQLRLEHEEEIARLRKSIATEKSSKLKELELNGGSKDLEQLESVLTRKKSQCEKELTALEGDFQCRRANLEARHKEEANKFKETLRGELKELRVLHTQQLEVEKKSFKEQRERERDREREALKQEAGRHTEKQDRRKADLRKNLEEEQERFRQALDREFAFNKDRLKAEMDQQLAEQRVSEKSQCQLKLEIVLDDLEREQEAKMSERELVHRKELTDLEMRVEEEMVNERDTHSRRRDEFRKRIKFETTEFFERLREEERSTRDKMRAESEQRVEALKKSIPTKVLGGPHDTSSGEQMVELRDGLRAAQEEIKELRMRQDESTAERSSQRTCERTESKELPSAGRDNISEPSSPDVEVASLDAITICTEAPPFDKPIEPFGPPRGPAPPSALSGLSRRLKYERDLVEQGRRQVGDHKRRVKKLTRRLEREQEAWRQRRLKSAKLKGEKKAKSRRSLGRRKKLLDNQAHHINKEVAFVKDMSRLLDEKETQLGTLEMTTLQTQLASTISPAPDLAGIPAPHHMFSTQSLHSHRSPQKYNLQQSTSQPSLDAWRLVDDSEIKNSSVGQLLQSLRNPAPPSAVLQRAIRQGNSLGVSQSSFAVEDQGLGRHPALPRHPGNEVVIRVKVER